ncbi:MAG: methylated-DNA--[protein]-cysteine S-methyltransferase [Planctomycetes bacterium]|nr:methylated-DNA--[protein]-cysteine S-methyltransferase [Planctomycetota bacterium]
MRWSFVETELGRLLIASSERGLARLDLHESRAREWIANTPGLVEDAAGLADTAAQLQEYARGARRVFELELDLVGTQFELRVWEALRAIPWGRTRTYGELAAAIGASGAARAVGGANGRNPVPIVVPCHRVVSGTGLGGFSGGLDVKQRLLALERVQLFA